MTDLVAVGFALFCLCLFAWAMIRWRRAKKEKEKLEFAIAQPVKFHYVAFGPVQKLYAEITVPDGTPRELVDSALAGKLARLLPEFWTVEKTVDYDVLYKATIYVQKPTKEG